MTDENSEITRSLQRWHEIVESQEMSQLSELLSDEVVFRSPFLHKPKNGKTLTTAILKAASQVFEDFVYHRKLTDGSSWALEFSARLGEIYLKGIDLIKFNSDGKITDFEVYIRPHKALVALSEAMTKQLVAQGDFEAFTRG